MWDAVLASLLVNPLICNVLPFSYQKKRPPTLWFTKSWVMNNLEFCVGILLHHLTMTCYMVWVHGKRPDHIHLWLLCACVWPLSHIELIQKYLIHVFCIMPWCLFVWVVLNAVTWGSEQYLLPSLARCHAVLTLPRRPPGVRWTPRCTHGSVGLQEA